MFGLYSWYELKYRPFLEDIKWMISLCHDKKILNLGYYHSEKNTALKLNLAISKCKLNLVRDN